MIHASKITPVPCLIALGAAGCSASAQVSTESPPSEPEPAAEPVADAPAPEADPEDVRIEGDHLMIDRKIHFATDNDEILEDSNEVLDHIAQVLNNHTEVATLHVIGHTDASGGHDHNQELSEKRAASVVAALKSRGVTQNIDSKPSARTTRTSATRRIEGWSSWWRWQTPAPAERPLGANFRAQPPPNPFRWGLSRSWSRYA